VTTLHEQLNIIDGALVRSTTELFRPYGVGRVQKVKNGIVKVEYSPSVFMPPPYRSENKLLKIEETERVESPLERAKRGQWDEAWRSELRMLAARFLTGNKGGQLSNARTEILPHQIFTAHRVVSSPHRRFLLADEVGLGKTIEAGMVWQALHQRGQAKRTLIIAPAGLTTQWKEEMKDKFGVDDFEIFGRDFLAVNPLVWNYRAHAIASLQRLKRKEHKDFLLASRKWDLIIFDEAHHLSAQQYGSDKVEKTLNYRLAEEIASKQYSEAFLLLTATPHQGEENHSRFKNLLGLLEKDIDFGSLEAVNLFSQGTGGRPFAELVIRTPKKAVTDAQGRTVFKGRVTHRRSCEMYPDEAKFYAAVAKYIRDGYQVLERTQDPTQKRAAGFLLTTFQKLNASSTAAIRSALTARLDRLRGQCDKLPFNEDDEELDERYEGEHEEKAAEQSDRELLAGEVSTLEKLLKLKVERDRKLDELLPLIDHIAKESARGKEEKVLIFTEYRKTQAYLVEELEKKYGRGSVAVIHGDMKLERSEDAEKPVEALWAPFAKDGALEAPTTKRTSQRLFRDHPKVRFLVSTEAGGEGINLQFCHICINYDLPWNPMRVEQRVGRVYRFGQDKVVQVYHFINRGTVEDLVQSYFEERLARAAKAIAKVTGEDAEEIKATLHGQLESELEHPQEIYKRAMVEGDLNKQTQQDIDEAVKRAKQAYELATKSLFRDVSSYSFDSYRKELATDLTLADLARFTERFLAGHRRQMQRKDSFIEFIVPDVLAQFKLPERVRAATFDRELAIRRTDAEFLALGHRVIDAMLEHVGSYDFGGLTAARVVKEPKLADRSGFLFAFVVRQRITEDGGDEFLFRFEPVFVTADGHIDPEALAPALSQEGVAANPRTIPDPEPAFRAAREHIEQHAGVWEWNDDVEFLGLSWVQFQ
jgi:ERCC4-related helicase